MLGCRLVRWNGKFVSAVAVDSFEWKNEWMEATCDDEMRKWQSIYSFPFRFVNITPNSDGLTLKMEPAPVPPHPEPVPAYKCKCGFYSVNSLREIGKVVGQPLDNVVLVLTQSAGRIVIHEHGYRAQYVRPVAVVYPFTYRKESRALHYTKYSFEKWLKSPLTLPWISSSKVERTYGHTLGHDAAMTAQKLRLPILSPTEASKMLTQDREKSNG
jgi:hypothetical protein